MEWKEVSKKARFVALGRVFVQARTIVRAGALCLRGGSVSL